MCLVTTQKKPKITLKRIKIYKVLEETPTQFISPFAAKPTPLNTVLKDYNIPERISFYRGDYFIEKGFFHTFKNISGAKGLLKDLTYMIQGNFVIVEGYIPAFTKMYIGTYSGSRETSYASKRIKYTKVINENI